MRIAHIIIAHKNPGQLARLIRKLAHPNFDFYIHIDLKTDISLFNEIREIPSVYFVEERIKCNWGGYSTLQAMLNSLKEALAAKENYDMFNLLSAQDYPLRSNADIYDFMHTNASRSFVFYETESAESWWRDAVFRYTRYHLTDFNFKGKYFVERIINAVLPSRTFPWELKLYGGCKSSWWILNREAACYLIDFLNANNNKSFFRYCWGTDEFVIPTVLLNSPLKAKIVNDNLRYIDFSEGKANPKILEPADLGSMRASGMLFARKFDIYINEEVLDQLDLIT